MEQYKATPDQAAQLAEYRGGQWQSAINAELTDLITQASELRSLINDAKTNTKKQYYQKKFKKVQKLVLQALVVKQRIDAKMGTTELIDALKEIDAADADYKASTGTAAEVDAIVNPVTFS